MKRNKTLLIGVLCGVICAGCVFAYTQVIRGEVEEQRNEALARYGGDQLEVCVAKRDIAPGETLDMSAIETRTWLADLLPESAISSADDVLGKQVSSTILAGEVITDKRFSTHTEALQVPSGKTAVSVPAQNVQAVGGAVKAGSVVDVYATGATSTKLIGTNISVIATDATSDGADISSVSWITLAVEPQAAQEIVAAVSTAELYFTLPSPKE